MLYNIAFKGEIAEGFDPGEVRANFSERFRKTDEVIEQLFSGTAITLAKDLKWESANTAVSNLRSLGALVYVLDEHDNVIEIPERRTANDAVGADVEPVEKAATPTPGENENTNPYDLTATAKIRLLTQITEEEVSETPPETSHRQGGFRYLLDTLLAKGGGSIFMALTAVFVATFFLIGVLRGALLLLFPEAGLQHEDLGFLGNLYITFLQITDPGNMAQDIYSSAIYKIFAVLAGVAGIVMFSALIAFITMALNQKSNELKRGHSKVIEKGHTLILGWNEQRIIETLRELVIANESEKDACVVVLADKDKQEMDDVLRLRLPDTGTTRVVTRSGDVSTLTNLDMVSLKSCASVIILASCEDADCAERKATSDAKAIQTVLATMGDETETNEFSIVVEIFNPTHREIVQSSFSDHVITVNTGDMLAGLLVLTSRSEGLSAVVKEMLSFDGCGLTFFDAEWGNSKFGAIANRFSNGVPMGIRNADGEIFLNPSSIQKMAPNDEVLILANDDSTIEFLDVPVATPVEHMLSGVRQQRRVERELMIGWTFKSAAIIRGFADYVIDGSQMHVLLKRPTDEQIVEIDALNKELDSIEVGLIQKDCLSVEDMLSVKPYEYDNIIILAGSNSGEAHVDAARVDAENIVSLLMLRRIFNQHPSESGNTKLITEILDSQNDGLVKKAGVQGVVNSNRFVSMITAQISQNRDIEKVYDDIFRIHGSAIYLKPANLYFETLPKDVSFADMMAIAQKRDEVCIGVKIKALENDKESKNGITLNPEKNTSYELQADDCLVVLAEDEL